MTGVFQDLTLPFSIQKRNELAETRMQCKVGNNIPPPKQRYHILASGNSVHPAFQREEKQLLSC